MISLNYDRYQVRWKLVWSVSSLAKKKKPTHSLPGPKSLAGARWRLKLNSDGNSIVLECTEVKCQDEHAAPSLAWHFQTRIRWLNAFSGSKCGIKARTDRSGIKYTISHVFVLLQGSHSAFGLRPRGILQQNKRVGYCVFYPMVICSWVTTSWASWRVSVLRDSRRRWPSIHRVDNFLFTYSVVRVRAPRIVYWRLIDWIEFNDKRWWQKTSRLLRRHVCQITLILSSISGFIEGKQVNISPQR